jgi:hypothetical protein
MDGHAKNGRCIVLNSQFGEKGITLGKVMVSRILRLAEVAQKGSTENWGIANCVRSLLWIDTTKTVIPPITRDQISRCFVGRAT